MSKPFEIFTEEDFTQGFSSHRILLAKKCNRILQERGQVGYTTQDKESYMTLISPYKRSHDTHEALVFLRPIEEEVECDFPHDKPLVGVYKGEGLSVHTPNFCPKCGKDLRDE
jgi:hypothetical protein